MSFDILLSAHDQSQYDHTAGRSAYESHDGPSQYHQQGQPGYQDAAHEDVEDHREPVDAPAPAPSVNEVTHERWTKTPQPRGRHAKDPHAEYIRFDCKDVDDLEINLAEYLSAPTAPAEHAIIEFHFAITAAFMVYTRDFKRSADTLWTPADVTDLMRRTAVSVVEVLQDTPNPKDQIVRQKAVARIIVEAVQRADGFRYSFHNNWLSREDRAHRFSYFCNDSTLNKGRAANGGVGMENRKIAKPVYDCKGLIAIKFSVTKNNLEVHYKHVPLHKTFAERAPPPRKESKRRRLLEVLDPKAAEQLSKRAARLPKAKDKSNMASAAKKRGRPKSLTSQIRPTSSGASRDEGLQPLVDFLGSAERQTPMHGADSDDDSDTGGIIMVDDGDSSTQNNEISRRAPSPIAAFPKEKVREMQTHTPPRKRPRLRGPMLPGQMVGSLQGGSLTWGTDPPAEQQLQAPENQESRSGEKQKGQGKGAKNAEKNRSSSGADLVGSGPVSELELLKQQLAATQQRLEKLESEKRQPPLYPPYPPPYHYPPYPYPPPPPGYYPPPPPPLPPQNLSTATPKQPAYTISDESFRHHELSASATPMYPGGPPHPNAKATITKHSVVTPKAVQIVGQQGQKSPSSPRPDAPAGTVSEARMTDSAERRLRTQNDSVEQRDTVEVDRDALAHPRGAHGATVATNIRPRSQPPNAGEGNDNDENSTTVVRADSAPIIIAAATSTPLEVAQNVTAPATQIPSVQIGQRDLPWAQPTPGPPKAALENPQIIEENVLANRTGPPGSSSFPSRQETSGIFKNTFADTPSLNSHTSASTSRPHFQQPQSGVVDLPHPPGTPGAYKTFHRTEDTKMQGYFHNTLGSVNDPPLRVVRDAVRTPQRAPPSSADTRQTPGWKGPTYAPGYGPQWQPDLNRVPPPGLHHAHPPQHGSAPPQAYPYPYPYPPPQYPYQGNGPPPRNGHGFYYPPPPGAQSHWPAHPPPTPVSATTPIKPKENPPPGYDDLRAQMVAHAQLAFTLVLKSTEQTLQEAPTPEKHNQYDSSAGADAVAAERGTVPAGPAARSSLLLDTALTTSPRNEPANQRNEPRSAVTVSSSGSTNQSVETAPEEVDQGREQHEEESNASNTPEEAL